MNFPPPPFGGSAADPAWSGGPDFGFGAAHHAAHHTAHHAAHHAPHRERQQARRQFREQLCHDGPDPSASFGFGPGFQPGMGPRGGHRGHGPGRHGRPGHRGRRGDVRAAILVLLAEQPMHGYQVIQEIAERSLHMWRPSPGSVYPTLQLLVDEGLVVGVESEGSKRLFELTEDGRNAADKIAVPPWQEIADGVDPDLIKLRAAVDRLFGAVAQATDATIAEQRQRVVDIVNNARREIYGILGEAD